MRTAAAAAVVSVGLAADAQRDTAFMGGQQSAKRTPLTISACGDSPADIKDGRKQDRQDELQCESTCRPVRLGMFNLLWPFATHWAVQIGHDWYEVRGASKRDSNAPMAIRSSRHPVQSGVGAHVSRFGKLGVTSRTDEEIRDWIDEWTASNPAYFWGTSNCQKFARELIHFLTDGSHKPLPLMDSGVGGNRAIGPKAWAGAEQGSAYAGATVGSLQGHHVLWNGALDAPNAHAAALCGRVGFGAFGEAELGRIEGGIGPVRVAAHFNINTSIGFRNSGLEVLVAGFGFKVGANGFSASLPFVTVGIGRRT